MQQWKQLHESQPSFDETVLVALQHFRSYRLATWKLTAYGMKLIDSQTGAALSDDLSGWPICWACFS